MTRIGDEKSGYRQASDSGSGAPGAHAPTHRQGGTDPVALDADQITSGTLGLMRHSPYARWVQVENKISGTITAGAPVYASPGTVASGAATPTRVFLFKVLPAAMATPHTWILYGLYGELRVAPGGTDTCKVTVCKRTGGVWADTTATFTITGPAITGTDEAHNPTFTNNDEVGIKVEVSGGAGADLALTLTLLHTQ